MNTQEKIYVADNPSTSVETLDVLSRDADADVRRGVARNPRTPKISP